MCPGDHHSVDRSQPRRLAFFCTFLDLIFLIVLLRRALLLLEVLVSSRSTLTPIMRGSLYYYDQTYQAIGRRAQLRFSSEKEEHSKIKIITTNVHSCTENNPSYMSTPNVDTGGSNMINQSKLDTSGLLFNVCQHTITSSSVREQIYQYSEATHNHDRFPSQVNTTSYPNGFARSLFNAASCCTATDETSCTLVVGQPVPVPKLSQLHSAFYQNFQDMIVPSRLPAKSFDRGPAQ